MPQPRRSVNADVRSAAVAMGLRTRTRGEMAAHRSLRVKNFTLD
ncbi:hypothetical protein SCH4B_4055 [Ruegeria sp. TrichCH4B]|nr:hypothetical protein SCH4B_4055 [Ruegeria sp. TrichCH4B]